MKSAWSFFRAFFINYLWLGVTILLLSVILDLQYPEDSRSNILTIVIKLIDGIGISVLIASIFTFASGSSQFIEKINTLLKDIVVRRDFLSNIDTDSKREALKSLIQPSSIEKNKYPNIGDYYGYFIDKTLEIKEKSVRSNYSMNVRAFSCKTHKIIAVEGIYTYRLYPSSTGFNDIVIGFEDDKSFCSSVVVSDPAGERKVFNEPALKEFVEGGDSSNRATLSIKEFASGKNHIDVELNLTEYGKDHWKMIQFKALQPTDGFRFQLYCEDEIEIREHAIFVVGAKYQLSISSNNKSVSFSCNQWVNEGTGLCFLVAIPSSEKELTPVLPDSHT